MIFKWLTKHHSGPTEAKEVSDHGKIPCWAMHTGTNILICGQKYGFTNTLGISNITKLIDSTFDWCR